MSTPHPDIPEPLDRSSPTLLVVSLVTVMASVVGVVALAATTTGWVLLVTLVVLLVGLVAVARTMARQLNDSGDDG
jgi:hypothetical protein